MTAERAARLGGLACLVGLLTYGLLRSLGTVGSFKATHWLFGYEGGIDRRALPGTLYRAVDPVVDPEGLIVVALGAVALAYGAVAAMLTRAASAQDWRLESVLVAGCLAVSPGLTLLAADLGRFDVLAYLLALAGLALLRPLGPIGAAAGAGAIGLVALLVHEASLVGAVPVLLVGLYLHARLQGSAPAWPRRWLLAGVAAASVLAAAFVGLVATQGAGPTVAPAEFRSLLADRAGFDVDPHAAELPLRDFGSHFADVFGEEAGALGPFVRDLRWTVPFVAIAFLVAGYALVRLAVPLDVALAILAAALAPLPLFLVGIDWHRWAQTMALNATLLTLLAMRWMPGGLAAGRLAGLAPAALPLLALALAALAGGGYTAFGLGNVRSPIENLWEMWQTIKMHGEWWGAFWGPARDGFRGVL